MWSLSARSLPSTFHVTTANFWSSSLAERCVAERRRFIATPPTEQSAKFSNSFSPVLVPVRTRPVPRGRKKILFV